MVKIRLKRFGRRNHPYYRICVMDQRSARDSAAIEEIGIYDPILKDQDKALRIDGERAKYWLNVGAQPSDTVKSLIRKAGIDAPQVQPAKS